MLGDIENHVTKLAPIYRAVQFGGDFHGLLKCIVAEPFYVSTKKSAIHEFSSKTR